MTRGAARGRAKLAVIGTGAAARGVLDALLSETASGDITVFDIGEKVRPEPEIGDPAGAAKFYDGVYRELRATASFRFPPPKTHLGTELPRHGDELLASRTLGGLTNFWGATMLPFTISELKDWPIEQSALAPHYARMAEIAGISGDCDGLDAYFQGGYVNRPPVSATPILLRLRDVINARDAGCTYRIAAGTNRCAIETRRDADRRCTGCGECLAGCFRGAIYSTRRDIERLLSHERVRYIRAPVLAINSAGGAVTYADGKSRSDMTGFSRVFLAAGCLGSTEILLRSTGLREADELRTNSAHVFPIVNLGRGDGASAGYVALSNLILACMPRGNGSHFAQVQIYPNPDYLYRYNAPRTIWPLLRSPLALSRSRLFWGRLFVHSDYSQTYRIRLAGRGLRIEDGRKADRAHAAEVLASVRQAINGQGFWIPRMRGILQRSSAHYGSTLGYGNRILNVPANGELMPHVHICDSTCFPALPAVSPTFTIMANARRTALEALHD